jgi:ATP-dependent Clp protease ATP-binding subunit ClpX
VDDGSQLEKVEAADLMKFGLIPEFVGRLPVVMGLTALDESQLVQVLTEPKNSLVEQYKALFKYDKCDLEFDNDALYAVAKQARLKGTGARGLRAIVEKALLEPMYEVPGSDIETVMISKDVIFDGVSPTYVTRVVRDADVVIDVEEEEALEEK